MSHPSPRRALLLALLLLTALPAFADTYDTATLVRIHAPDPAQVLALRAAHIDISGRIGPDDYKALLRGDELRDLTAQGFEIEVLYGEMESDRTRWTEIARAPAATSYYTASKFNTTNPPAGSLMEHLLQQYNAHKDITRLYNLGPSQDGAYDIIAMKISKNPDVVEAEPKIRIYGNIHGDEKGGCMVASDVLDTILSGYVATPQDDKARRLVDGSEMWFIPMGNPWGNAHNSRYNSRSVDLNRNFWGPAGSEASPAWSESETRAIRDLTEAATADHSKKRFTTSISFHEGATCFNSVWNYTSTSPTDEPIFWSARKGGSGCQAVNCPTIAPHGLAMAYKAGCTKPGMWYTEGYDWYGTWGDTNDWAYGAWTQLDTTVELNLQKTPAASEITTYCAQHRQAVLNYMLKSFQAIHGVMTDAATGAPLDGTVVVTQTQSDDFSVPRTYQQIYTDPVAGDFHRVVQPGTFTMTCSAPGYVPVVVPGLVVIAGAPTTQNCALSRTALRFDAATAADTCSVGGTGSGNGVLDAGETAAQQVRLANPGTLAATAVQGVLSTTAPGVTITRASATFATVPAGGTAWSLAPHFAYTVDPSLACGTVIPFALHLTATQGAWDVAFTVTVGAQTPAAGQTLWSEGFDATTFPPTGWAQENVSGTTGSWARGTATVAPSGGPTHSGAGLAYFNSYNVVPGTATRLTRTTPFALPAAPSTAAVSFWMYHDVIDASSDKLQVDVSTDGTAWVAVGEPIARYSGVTGWTQHTVALDAYAGQPALRVALRGVSGRGNDIHIDDVQVTTTPAPACAMTPCLAPAAPGEAAASALAWSTPSMLAWPATPSATSYRLYRGAPAELPALLDASTDSCTAYDGPATSAAAAHVPAPGSFDWYLVTAWNGALEGPAGNASAGPRSVSSTGACLP